MRPAWIRDDPLPHLTALGHQVVAARAARGLTQEQAAAAAGVTLSTVAHVEQYARVGIWKRGRQGPRNPATWAQVDRLKAWVGEVGAGNPAGEGASDV